MLSCNRLGSLIHIYRCAGSLRHSHSSSFDLTVPLTLTFNTNISRLTISTRHVIGALLGMLAIFWHEAIQSNRMKSAEQLPCELDSVPEDTFCFSDRNEKPSGRLDKGWGIPWTTTTNMCQLILDTCAWPLTMTDLGRF